MERAPLATRLYWTAFTAWHARHERTLPYWSAERLKRLQDRRVRAIARHAYRTVPFYRRAMDDQGLSPHDIRTAADLAELPTVTTDDYARDPRSFQSSAFRGRRVFEAFTSGTSGHPRVIPFDTACLFRSLAARHRQRVVVTTFTGRTFGYSEMAVGSALTLSKRLREFYEANSCFPRQVDFDHRWLLSFGNPAERIEELNRARPDVLRGYGSFIGLLYRWAYEHGLEIHRPTLVWYGGDRLLDADRLLIAGHYGIPVRSSYQTTEALVIAYQCELGAGFHVAPDHVAVRVIDERGANVGPGGSGEILVSNLVNRATVLLNHRLGDLVTLGDGPCPCGRTGATIAHIEGRADDYVLHPNGTILHSMIAIGKLQLVPGMLQQQLHQEELTRFVVRAVLRPGADAETVRAGIDAAMRETYGDDVVTLIEFTDVIPAEPSGKFKLVSSRCAPRGAGAVPA